MRNDASEHRLPPRPRALSPACRPGGTVGDDDAPTRSERSISPRGRPGSGLVGTHASQTNAEELRYGYATLVRVERTHRARSLLQRGLSPADVSAMTGYADQSHLTREFARMVGVSLSS